MEKRTKNIITRESCYKELLHTAKADIYLSIVLLAIMLVIFVPLSFLGVYIAKYVVVLGVVFALACYVVPAYMVFDMVRHIRALKMVHRGEFSIVKDTVSLLSPGEPMGKSTVNAIYFSVYGRYLPGDTAYDLTSVDDEYYLVVMDIKKYPIQMAFHSLLYEYKEK